MQTETLSLRGRRPDCFAQVLPAHFLSFVLSLMLLLNATADQTRQRICFTNLPGQEFQACGPTMQDMLHLSCWSLYINSELSGDQAASHRVQTTPAASSVSKHHALCLTSFNDTVCCICAAMGTEGVFK